MLICKALDQQGREIKVFLVTGNGPPRIAVEAFYPCFELDDARRLARAILAIPRPIDAKPETE